MWGENLDAAFLSGAIVGTKKVGVRESARRERRTHLPWTLALTATGSCFAASPLPDQQRALDVEPGGPIPSRPWPSWPCDPDKLLPSLPACAECYGGGHGGAPDRPTPRSHTQGPSQSLASAHPRRPAPSPPGPPVCGFTPRAAVCWRRAGRRVNLKFNLLSFSHREKVSKNSLACQNC